MSEDLEAKDIWDFEKTERRPGVKSPRAIVSVAFQRDEFEIVCKIAENLGMPVSRFIREAALGRIPGQFGSFTSRATTNGWWYTEGA